MRWGVSLLDEWTNVIVREGQTTPEKAALQRAKFTTDFVEGMLDVDHENHALARPLTTDHGDVHVAACALAATPCTLLTFNEADFDVAGLARRGVVVRDPGEWLADVYTQSPIEQQREWLLSLEEHRKDLNNPSLTPAEYIDILTHVELDPFSETVREAFLALKR